MLTKVYISENIPSVKIVPEILTVYKHCLIKNSLYFSNGDIVMNKKACYKIINNQVIILNKLQRLPLQIENKIIWKSLNTFMQNNRIVHNQIYKYVNNQFTSGNLLVGIGGEFYTYFVLLKNKYKSFIGITNNINIYNDAKFNCNLYNLDYKLELVDYNKSELINDNQYDIIINLSKLNNYSIKCLLSNKNIQNIILITCNLDSFNKNLPILLKQYKLISNKYIKSFDKYIIITKLIRKPCYISLGGSCAVSYNLKKHQSIPSYPFDWCKMSIKQLNKTLERNFKDFTKLKIKKFSPNHENSYLLTNQDNIQFAHELFIETDLNNFQKKIFRRINRFNKLKNPIFIRFETSKLTTTYQKELDNLKSNLRNLFTNYKLVLIVHKNHNIKHENIYTFEEFNSNWEI